MLERANRPIVETSTSGVLGSSIAQSPCLENRRKWVQPRKYFDSGSLDLGCCEQAHKGFAERVCPPAPRQAHDVPHQILALLRSSLPAFRGRFSATLADSLWLRHILFCPRLAAFAERRLRGRLNGQSPAAGLQNRHQPRPFPSPCRYPSVSSVRGRLRRVVREPGVN